MKTRTQGSVCPFLTQQSRLSLPYEIDLNSQMYAGVMLIVGTPLLALSILVVNKSSVRQQANEHERARCATEIKLCRANNFINQISTLALSFYALS